MAFPTAFIDELLARNPIEDVVGQYVTLRRSGSNMFGLCPFHGEKTASFSVAPDKGIYYCFGCHKGGSSINFMMELEGLSYPDAVRALAKRAGMQVPEDEQYQNRYQQQERLWALMKEAGRFFHAQLYAPVGAEGLAYAKKRGLSQSILTRFGVGYAPNSWNALVDAMRKKGYTDKELKDADLVGEKNGRIYDRFRNRLMFPIIDVRGNVVGFGGRVLDDSKPKYLNTSETVIFNKRKNLFGLNFAKKTKLGSIILVEGNLDVITLHQFGFDNAVASLGTSLTEDHAALLSRYTEQVILTYDGDEAGQRAAKRAIPMLEKAGMQVKVLQMQDAKDPDEFLHKFGPERFRQLMEGSADRVDYQLSAIARNYNLKVDEQRVKYLQEAAELISSLPSAIQREIYGTRLAEQTSVSADAVKLEISKAYKRRIARQKKAQEQLDLTPAQALQPKDRHLHYSNLRSARAEEEILAQILLDPSLLDKASGLKPEMFSAPLLKNVYSQLLAQYQKEQQASLGALSDLTAEEMSHLTGIISRPRVVDEQVFRGCVRTVLDEYQKANVVSDADLMARRNKLKESKGT